LGDRSISVVLERRTQLDRFVRWTSIAQKEKIHGPVRERHKLLRMLAFATNTRDNISHIVTNTR
jgi:hypothetical protein